MSELADRLCWDDIEVFCLVAERGSLRQAAAARGESYETVRRRINALEIALGERLFRRTTQGLAITTAGREILVKAREAHDAIAAIARRSGADRRRERRQVRLVFPEDIGALWLLPALAEFEMGLKGGTGLALEFTLGRPGAPIDWDAADIAVDYREPSNPDVIRRRIGQVAFRFCDRQNGDGFGFAEAPPPGGLVLLPADDHPAMKAEALAAWLRASPPSTVWRVGSAAAIRDLVASTDAIGLLPGGAARPASTVQTLTLWLGFHRDVGEAPATRELIDRLAALGASLETECAPYWKTPHKSSAAPAFHES
jgi:DNA-binding transcriptional LysR family regulator